MAQRLLLDDRRVWLKHYDSNSRRISLGLLDRLARVLSIEALRVPPRPGGVRSLSVELRRVTELKAADVKVPEVLGQGAATLLLADIGTSLAKCLKCTSGDPVARDDLVRRAIDAIADVHAKGLYLGNPVPRNMTFDNQCIGFLDFEEDPGEIMGSDVAQSRDWLLFVHAVARYYPSQHLALAQLLRVGLGRAQPEVSRRVLHAGSKLGLFAALLWPFQRNGGKIRHALKALGAIAGDTLLLAIAMGSTAQADDDGVSLGWILPGIFL